MSLDLRNIFGNAAVSLAKVVAASLVPLFALGGCAELETRGGDLGRAGVQAARMDGYALRQNGANAVRGFILPRRCINGAIVLGDGRQCNDSPNRVFPGPQGN